jgi:hypothetical protein
VENSDRLFVSHSSKDTKLIDLIALGFKGRDITPFFARRVMVGENPVEKIINAIDSSMALFCVMTSNVVYDNHTRDWVVFELAVAKTKGKPIFCWMDESVATLKAFPKLIENLTDYDTFKPLYDKECYRVVNSMVDKAFELKGRRKIGSKPTEKELRKGLIQMEETKKIATDFISKEKSFNSIDVNSVEPKGDRWIVKGSIFTKTKHGGGSERWTVEIEGETVLSFKFESGAAWAIM